MSYYLLFYRQAQTHKAKCRSDTSSCSRRRTGWRETRAGKCSPPHSSRILPGRKEKVSGQFIIVLPWPCAHKVSFVPHFTRTHLVFGTMCMKCVQKTFFEGTLMCAPSFHMACVCAHMHTA